MKGSGAGSPWAALGGGWVCAAGGLKSWLQAGDLTVVGVPRIRSAARLVLAMRPQQAPVSGKVFIQRDYSSGTRCQFQTKFPAELENRIDRQQFEETVRTLNNLYAEAEKLGGQSYLEGCLACLTAYTIFLCMETHYEKKGPLACAGWEARHHPHGERNLCRRPGASWDLAEGGEWGSEEGLQIHSRAEREDLCSPRPPPDRSHRERTPSY
uniref:Golgin subfamily A member 7 n=1 Tax=Sus scrofa TaxID=9823 RepID=A0A8D0SW59_PIG